MLRSEIVRYRCPRCDYTQEYTQPNMPDEALDNEKKCPACGYPDPPHPGWTSTKKDFVDPEMSYD